MNIGMISKPAHAKSHVQALQKQGHKVIPLGGNPSKIQPSLDILVCRPASCSHGGFDTAMAHKRKGKEVIFANGVLEICQAVQAAVEETAPAAPKERGVAPLITQLAQLLGVYSSLLHVAEAGPVVQWLADRNGTTDEAMKVWGEARKAYKTNSVRSRLQESGKNSGKEAKKRGWDLHWAHTAPPYGGSRKVALVVADSSVVEETCRRLRVFLTAEEATAQAKTARAAYEAKRKSERGATKAESATKAKPIPVKAKTKPAPPVVAKTAPVEPPSAVQPGEGGVPRAQAWDAQLKSAIGLLLAEMREVQVTALTVTTAGAVSFERVVTTTGSMTVNED